MNNRIIVKPSLFSNQSYINLTKEETDLLFKIVCVFADSYQDKLHYQEINNILGDIDYSPFSSILEFEDDEFVLIGNHFKTFKTKVYTAKSRLKSKTKMLKEIVEEHIENLNNLIKTEDELEEEIKEDVKKEIKNTETFDFDKIKEIWNNEFKDTIIPKISFISDARKKTIKNFYFKIVKLVDIKDIKPEVFYATYFNKFSKLNISKNGNPKTNWKPEFDYIMKESTFIKLKEGSLF